MSVIENSKLTVVGAGAVGSSVAYAALIRESARHVALYDIAAEKTEAEVLDLAHGSQFTGGTDIVGSSDIEVARDSDIVVITAGAKQKPGQSRRELADTNARITRTLMEQLLSVAPEAVYVIVTNPCDPMAMVAQEFSGLPANQVFSSGTTLDTSRLRWLLADRADVSRTSVHAHIVGEKIIAAACQPFEVDGELLQIGASVGVAFGVKPGEGWRELVARADAQLYRAKQGGRGRQAGATNWVDLPPDA